LTSFASLSLADEIHRAIRDSGYTNPTPIQAQMIPLIQEGHDVIGLSQTGTGKTAAFVLPILHQLATSKTRARRGSCSVLILSPTRELTNQIADTVRRYGKYINYAQAIIVGGVSYPPQIKALRRGVDIVIATPGRALDHIESGELGLDETTTIILDEADQMLDFGFLPVIKKIIERLPEQRQAVLLSATMPKAVKGLAESLMTEPKLVEATPESKPVDRVSQQVIMVEKSRKNMALLEIISQKEVDRAIVFVRTKFGADRVQTFLNNYGILAVSLHGNKSQGQRQRALGQFRKGEVAVLVATDIAGRGIDIDDVSHVINVDLPNIPESYVHRIGRTARAGREGVAISFCSKGEKPFLRDIEKLIGMELPKRADEPGKVLIKPSDATPLRAEPRFDHGNKRGGKSDHKSDWKNDRKNDKRKFGKGKLAKDSGKPKAPKPKPIDPNLVLPDDLMDTRPKGNRRDGHGASKPMGAKPFGKRTRSEAAPSRSSKPAMGRGKAAKFGKSDQFEKTEKFGGKTEKFGKAEKSGSSNGKPSGDARRGNSKKTNPKNANPKNAGAKNAGPKNAGPKAKSGQNPKSAHKTKSAKPNNRRRFDAPAERGLRRKAR
jgi:ATP-dependent RNA helicase RhlE